MSRIFSDHNAMRLEINHKKKHKHMEAKQYATRKPVGHGSNQGGTQTIPQTI